MAKGLMMVSAIGLALGAGATLGGCSQPLITFQNEDVAPTKVATTSVPAADPVTTGSIAKHPLTFGSDLGAEDWRRAQAALAVALDPQGNGRPVKWDNPESALRGSVNPTGLPYVSEDEVCRDFLASVIAPNRSRFLRGTGCKPAGSAWELKRLRTARKSPD